MSDEEGWAERLLVKSNERIRELEARQDKLLIDYADAMVARDAYKAALVQINGELKSGAGDLELCGCWRCEIRRAYIEPLGIT